MLNFNFPFFSLWHFLKPITFFVLTNCRNTGTETSRLHCWWEDHQVHSLGLDHVCGKGQDDGDSNKNVERTWVTYNTISKSNVVWNVLLPVLGDLKEPPGGAGLAGRQHLRRDGTRRATPRHPGQARTRVAHALGETRRDRDNGTASRTSKGRE